MAWLPGDARGVWTRARGAGEAGGPATAHARLQPGHQGGDPPVGADGTRTAGVDLTYSPPKDVSALWALSDPYRRAQIEAAHRKAVASTLKRIEKEVALVRRKTNGVVRFERAKSLLAAEAVHTTSRLSREQPQDGIPDPQLHSHVAVIAAERMDGKMAAVESRQLMLAAREGGSWYRSELAANLRELGLDIERRTGKGERYFGISGVPDALSDRWSTRDGDVDRAAQAFRRRNGREPEPGELDQLTLKTRGPKSTASQPDIEKAYDAVGSEYDFTRRDVAKLTAGSEHQLQPHTQALNEHARYIDKVLEQQRRRLFDEEQQLDRDQDNDREHQTDQAQDSGRDPYIEQAIQEERDRQQAFEQGIDNDRDNNLGFGIE